MIYLETQWGRPMVTPMSFEFANTPEEVDSITEEAIERADAIVGRLVASSPRTTLTTLLPLDEIGAVIGDSFGRGGFMAFVHPDPAVRRGWPPSRGTSPEVGGGPGFP